MYPLQSLDALISLYSQRQPCRPHEPSLVVYSFAEKGNNDFIIGQLFEYFVRGGRLPFLVIVKPPQSQDYRLSLNQVSQNRGIREVEYPSRCSRRS